VPRYIPLLTYSMEFKEQSSQYKLNDIFRAINHVAVDFVPHASETISFSIIRISCDERSAPAYGHRDSAWIVEHHLYILTRQVTIQDAIAYFRCESFKSNLTDTCPNHVGYNFYLKTELLNFVMPCCFLFGEKIFLSLMTQLSSSWVMGIKWYVGLEVERKET
jgi:hypothetical protein